MRDDYYNLSAKERCFYLCDENTFTEVCPASHKFISPHLKTLALPVSEDDGVVIGLGIINGFRIMLISQDSSFYGGSVGEIHGARIKGFLDSSVYFNPDGIVFLIDSGGVRLQEANAGLVGLSEIIKSLLVIRSKGIPVIAVIGGSCGAFGGMGILARLCSEIIITEKGRIGLSGPEVIETLKGIDEFNSHNKALILNTVGAQARKEIGEVKFVVKNNITEIRKAIVNIITESKINSIEFYKEVFNEHEILKKRLHKFKT